MPLDGMTYLSVRGTRMLEHLHGRAANDQLPVLDVPLLTVLELVDEQAAQFRDVLGAGGVVDETTRLPRVLVQIEVLLDACLDEPQVLIALGDDPLIGLIAVAALLAVQVRAIGLFGAGELLRQRRPLDPLGNG